MKQAIQRNRQRHKYRTVLRRLRVRIFEYEDAGKGEKATKLMKRCERIIA